MSFRQTTSKTTIGGQVLFPPGVWERKDSASWAVMSRSVCYSICTVRDRIRRLWLNGGHGMAGVGPSVVSRQGLGVVMRMWEAFPIDFVQHTKLIIHDTKAMSLHSGV